MDEFSLMIPEGYEGRVEKMWKDYDSWDRMREVDVSGLDDDESEDDDYPDEDDY